MSQCNISSWFLSCLSSAKLVWSFYQLWGSTTWQGRACCVASDREVRRLNASSSSAEKPNSLSLFALTSPVMSRTLVLYRLSLKHVQPCERRLSWTWLPSHGDSERRQRAAERMSDGGKASELWKRSLHQRRISCAGRTEGLGSGGSTLALYVKRRRKKISIYETLLSEWATFEKSVCE